MILSFAFGFICAVVALASLCNHQLNFLVKKGHFAAARYNEKKKRWEVTGKLSDVTHKLADIQAGRQPGAIKYVD